MSIIEGKPGKEVLLFFWELLSPFFSSDKGGKVSSCLAGSVAYFEKEKKERRLDESRTSCPFSFLLFFPSFFLPQRLILITPLLKYHRISPNLTADQFTALSFLLTWFWFQPSTIVFFSLSIALFCRMGADHAKAKIIWRLIRRVLGWGRGTKKGG